MTQQRLDFADQHEWGGWLTTTNGCYRYRHCLECGVGDAICVRLAESEPS